MSHSYPSDRVDGIAAGDSSPDIAVDRFSTDPDPRCTYVVTFRPTVDENDHDRVIFEWVLDWLDCPDVTEVNVEYGERERDPVTVEIDSVEDCRRVGEIPHHERILGELESIGRLESSECRPIVDSIALE